MNRPEEQNRLSDPQPCPKELFGRLVAMLNEQMLHSRGLGGDIESKTPTAICPSNLENLRVILDGSNVISHVGMKYDSIALGNKTYRLGKISAVCTHQKYRSRGLALRLLEDCQKKMQRDNIDLSVLWTDLIGYYERLGWQYAGYEAEHHLKQKAASPISASRYSIGPTPKYCSALHEIREKTPYLLIERDPDETQVLIRRKGVSTITAYVREDPVAYVVTRGSENDIEVLESAGPSDALPILINALFERERPRQIIMHTGRGDPRHEVLTRSDSAWTCETKIGSSGMWWTVPKENKGQPVFDFARFYVEYLDRV